MLSTKGLGLGVLYPTCTRNAIEFANQHFAPQKWSLKVGVFSLHSVNKLGDLFIEDLTSRVTQNKDQLISTSSLLSQHSVYNIDKISFYTNHLFIGLSLQF